MKPGERLIPGAYILTLGSDEWTIRQSCENDDWRLTEERAILIALPETADRLKRLFAGEAVV